MTFKVKDGLIVGGTLALDATGNLTTNAATATKLQTARTINGVSFDGSANITITAASSSLLTRGTYLTGSNYDGSAATTWAVDATSANTPSKVVARDVSGNFVAGTITAALTGNASTATKLATARSISLGTDATGSATFDGSADITIPVTLANSGVVAGTYGKVTVNAKGLVTVGASLAASDLPTLTASKISDFDTQVRTNRLDQMAAPTASVAMNNQLITGLATPVNDTDAANKGYVDALKQGLDIKDSVRVVATGNINIAAPGTAIDGVTLATGNRVLLAGQTTTSQNGIYLFNGSAAAMTRTSDADTSAKVTAGLFTFVTEGTANSDSGWVLTTNDTITLGTTGLSFTQFSGAGQVSAGAGLTKTGNTVDVVTASSARIVVNADNIDLATTGVAAGTYSSLTVDTYGRVTAATAATLTRGTYLTGSNYDGSTGTTWAVDATNANTPSKVVARDASGNFSAGTITAALSGNATTATTLQTARTINGVSFDGSANITITDSTKLSTSGGTISGTLTHGGLVPSSGTNIDQIMTTTKSLTLTTAWQDTGIKATDLATGSYMIQVLVSDSAVGGGHVTEYYTGTMSWFAGDPNSTVADEISLHRAGSAPGTGAIFLRVQRTSTADANDLKLQIAGTTANIGASNYAFSFRRLI